MSSGTLSVTQTCLVQSDPCNSTNMYSVVQQQTYYRILPNTRASPNRRAPSKFLDHVPEVSRPKIYMTTLFNDWFNAVLMICLLHPMK